MPQMEVVHARALTEGGGVRQSPLEPGEMFGMPQPHLASCNGNPEGETSRVCVHCPVGWSRADWSRASGIQLLCLARRRWRDKGPRPRYMLSQTTNYVFVLFLQVSCVAVFVVVVAAVVLFLSSFFFK